VGAEPDVPVDENGAYLKGLKLNRGIEKDPGRATYEGKPTEQLAGDKLKHELGGAPSTQPRDRYHKDRTPFDSAKDFLDPDRTDGTSSPLRHVQQQSNIYVVQRAAARIIKRFLFQAARRRELQRIAQLPGTAFPGPQRTVLFDGDRGVVAQRERSEEKRGAYRSLSTSKARLPARLDDAPAAPSLKLRTKDPKLVTAMRPGTTEWYFPSPRPEKGTKPLEERVREATVPMLWRFIAVLLLAGLHGKDSNHEQWWSTDPLRAFSPVRLICTGEEFRFVLRHIHTEDSVFLPDRDADGRRQYRPRRGAPGFDKVFKLRRWSKILNDVFRCNYKPGRHISFDEMMIASVARISFRVFMKGKPIRRGFKKWACCDAITRYCLRSSLFTGSDDIPGQDELGALGATVHEELLAAGLLEGGRHIVMDRAFTSIPLLYKLRSLYGTTATGTINGSFLAGLLGVHVRHPIACPKLSCAAPAAALGRSLHCTIFARALSCTLCALQVTARAWATAFWTCQPPAIAWSVVHTSLRRPPWGVVLS